MSVITLDQAAEAAKVELKLFDNLDVDKMSNGQLDLIRDRISVVLEFRKHRGEF